MDTSTNPNWKPGATVRTIVTALVLATALGTMSTTITRAEDRGRHVEHRHVDRGHGGYAYEQPRAYYAAPPVDYYQPPPPSPGIDFIFPLHIR